MKVMETILNSDFETDTRISPRVIDSGKLEEDALTTRWLPRFWTLFHDIMDLNCKISVH